MFGLKTIDLIWRLLTTVVLFLPPGFLLVCCLKQYARTYLDFFLHDFSSIKTPKYVKVFCFLKTSFTYWCPRLASAVTFIWFQPTSQWSCSQSQTGATQQPTPHTTGLRPAPSSAPCVCQALSSLRENTNMASDLTLASCCQTTATVLCRDLQWSLEGRALESTPPNNRCFIEFQACSGSTRLRSSASKIMFL